MALVITRIFEDNPGTGGVNFANTEISLLNGVFWLGLSTDASDLNNLPSGTEVTVTDGTDTVVVTLGAQTFVNSTLVTHPYTLVSGAVNFADGASVTVTVDNVVSIDVQISAINPGPGDLVNATITLDSTGTGLTDSDITVSHGTKGTLTQNGLVYTLPITLPLGVTGLNTLTVTVAEDAVTEGNLESIGTRNFGTVVDRIFLFDAQNDDFNAFDFSGAAQTTEGFDPGIENISAAYATDSRIYAYNPTDDEIHVWDLFWNELLTFAPNAPTAQYRGMTANDDDLILVNDDLDILEFYDLITGDYDSSKDVSLTTGQNWMAAARGGDNLFLGNNSDDRVYIRTLAGAAVSDFSAGVSINLQTIFVTSDRVHLVNRNTGDTVAFDFSGVAQSSDDLALGSGRWLASFSLFTPAVIVLPGAPTSLVFTATENGIVATWEAATNNGGEAPTRYDIRIDSGSWIDTGLDLTHAFSGLTADTLYTIEVAQVNSAGRGTAVSGTQRTSETTPDPLTFGSSIIAAQAWTVGTAINLTLPEATGGEGTITYSLSPTTPTGVTFTAGTQVLAGTPTGRFTSATFTYTATDGNSDTVELTFTIVVTAPAISFNSMIAAQAWVVGEAVSLTLPTASGGVGTLTYSLSPTLPGGVSRANFEVSGTPTGRFTSATFTYTATDAENVAQTTTFTIVVTADAITFSPTSFSNQTWEVGTAVDLTLPVGSGGVGDLTPTLSPALPAGVTFTASTRALAGNPSAVFSVSTFTYTMTDTEGESASITFNIVVNAAAVPLSFGAATIPNQTWTIDAEIDLSLPEATGGEGTISYSLTGTLPGGVSFTSGTRALAGTPTAAFASAEFTYTATDDNDSVDLTFTIAVTAVTVVTSAGEFAQIRVSLKLEIEGQDITGYLVPGQPLQFNTELDFPDFGVFKAAGLQILLDNQGGQFDTGGSFWSDNNLPPSGSGAKALLTVTRDGDTWRFAGQIVSISYTLKTKITTCVIRDLSLLMRFGVDPSLGQEVTRRITDYDGATADYAEGQYWFRLPLSLYPIKSGTLSAKTVDGDTETEVTIVDEVKTSGVLSPTTASVDAENGIIKFEAAPAAAEATVIEATWKLNFRYNRPDRLLFELLKGSGVVSKQGLTDAQARYAIEQSAIENDTPVFSSHGRPFFEKAGIVRWMMRDATSKKRYMTHDDKLLEYDEGQDEYTELAEFPLSASLEAPPAYGTYLSSESFDLPSVYDFSGGGGICLTEDEVLIDARRSGVLGVFRFNRMGEEISSTPAIIASHRGLSFYNNLIWAQRSNNIKAYNTSFVEQTEESGTYNAGSGFIRAFAIGALGFYATKGTSLHFTSDLSVNATIVFTTDFSLSSGIAVSENTIWMSPWTNPTTIIGLDIDNTRNVNKDIPINLPSAARIRGLDYYNNRLYVLYASDTSDNLRVNVYYVGGESTGNNYVPYRFDTHDFEDFYALVADTATGNQVNDRSFSPCRVIKYDKSADTFDTILDEDDGQPQLAHPYTDAGSEVFRADNRKNFQVVRRSNKTLIFFRRVESDQSSIAVKNETDDTTTNIHTSLHSLGDGLPYSMDFGLDIRSDGIHVYSFVVYYDDDDSTLLVYRERFQPSGTETEIFTETIARVDDADGNAQYAVSVSDVILNDDDDKWYFVLTWHAEDDGTGKAELCTIAKDGTGSRTVLKTYDDPLLSARSPAKMGSRYFYLEGGWVRREKTSTDDDVPDEEHHYPNEGGTLIEIESDDSITDHGIIWRSATKAESPDPDEDNPVYDGWGLHNAVVSNLLADDRDNLHCVIGYGTPYDIEDNSPLSRVNAPIPNIANFPWIQWGKDLSSKIVQFKTAGKTYWGLAEQLAQLLGWELGFGPAAEVVEAFQTEHSGASDWSANSLIFLRPPSVRKGALRTAVAASGTASIAIDGVGVGDFPAGLCLIDKELFRYTGRTADTDGITLSGVTRAQDGSVAAAHNAEADVYFVTSLILDTDASLLNIDQKYLDITNLYNNIRVNYAGGTVQASDSDSIKEHSEFTLSIGTELLTAENAAWTDYLLNFYLSRYKAYRELLKARVPINVNLDLGELVVVKAGGGVNVDFKKYVVVRQSQDLQRFQTQLILREAD